MPVIIIPYLQPQQIAPPFVSPASLYFNFNTSVERESGTAINIQSGAIVQNGQLEATESNPLVTFSYAALALGTGNLTIETWYTTGSSFSTYQGIFTTANTNDGILITVDNGFVKGMIGLNNGNNIITHPTKLTIGSKNHIALIRNNQNLSLYVNGVHAGSDIANNQYNITRQNGKFFARYTNSTGFNTQTGAKIDEFRVSPTVLYTSNFTPTDPLEG